MIRDLTPSATRRAATWIGLSCLLLPGVRADAVELAYPVSVAVHESGSLYLADRNLPGVWRLEGEQLSIVFKGVKEYRTPLNAVRCVAIDREGKLLAGDSSTRDVYRLEDGTPTPLTGRKDGSIGIGIPMDIVADDDGNLLVSDLELHRIVKVPAAGGAVEDVAKISAPRGLCYDAQAQLWVISGRRLVRLSPQGEQQVIVDNGVFQFPHCVVVKDDGTAFVSDGYAKAIWRVPGGGEPEKWVSGDPFLNPVGLDMQGDKLFVVDPRANAVFEIDMQGTVTKRPAKPAG